MSFRNKGIYHEMAVNQILDDLVTACKPRQLKVTGEFNVRGGIKTTVSSYYPRLGEV
jgi:7-cyano-7-deazaguanine reductase